MAAASLSIDAEVSEQERPFVLAGAQQLGQALAAATGLEWPIRLHYCDPGHLATPPPRDTIVVLSLFAEVGRLEPIAVTDQRWRARLIDLTKSGAQVLICSVFRHVAERRTEGGAAILERIRRLNRMVADLSHDLGVTVVDIDRAFAHIGGRALGADYRLNGRLAAEVAGQTLVWSILSLGLDDLISPETQERAKAFHGGLSEIDTLVRRRLAQA